MIEKIEENQGQIRRYVLVATEIVIGNKALKAVREVKHLVHTLTSRQEVEAYGFEATWQKVAC